MYVHVGNPYYSDACQESSHCNYEAVYTFLGKEEDEADKLRSILAQLEYKYRVDMYVSEGVPFDQHLYWPEKHPQTGEFSAREKMKVMFSR